MYMYIIYVTQLHWKQWFYVLYLLYMCVFTTAIPFTLHYCTDLLTMVVCI